MNSETMTGRKYNLNPDILNDIKNSIDWAEEKRLIEGEKRGIIKVARSLLLSGMDIEFIAKATELSIDEINRTKDVL